MALLGPSMAIYAADICWCRNRYDGRDLTDQTRGGRSWYAAGVKWAGVTAMVAAQCVAIRCTTGSIARAAGGIELSLSAGILVSAGRLPRHDARPGWSAMPHLDASRYLDQAGISWAEPTRGWNAVAVRSPVEVGPEAFRESSCLKGIPLIGGAWSAIARGPEPPASRAPVLLTDAMIKSQEVCLLRRRVRHLAPAQPRASSASMAARRVRIGTAVGEPVPVSAGSPTTTDGPVQACRQSARSHYGGGPGQPRASLARSSSSANTASSAACRWARTGGTGSCLSKNAMALSSRRR